MLIEGVFYDSLEITTNDSWLLVTGTDDDEPARRVCRRRLHDPDLVWC